MDILIRDVTVEDSQALVEIYSYYVENTAITFEYDVPSVQEFTSRIENIQKKYPYLCAVLDGKIVGYAYANVFKARPAYDWSVETTIYVHKDYTKCGIGKLLYTELESKLKKLGIQNMYACIAYPEFPDEYLTKNSPEFHQHLGFQTVGEFHKCGKKFNRWYNMIWMEKLIGNHE